MDKSNSYKVDFLKKFKPYFMLLPLILLYLIFIAGGFLDILKESLGFIPVLGFKTLKINAYTEIIENKRFIINLGFSIYVTLTATLLSALLSIIISYSFIITNNKYLKLITTKALQAGLIIPYLYSIFLAMLFLTKTGFISRLFYNLGIIKNFDNFPELIFDNYGIGIIFVYVLKATPFISLFLINVMSKISNTYKDISKTLGAKDDIILKKIYLPLCTNTIIWTSSVILAYDFGSFEVPYLLASNYPTPLSRDLYSLFINPDISNIPKAMAMNIIIFVIGVTLVLFYSLIIKLVFRRKLRWKKQFYR